MAGGVWLVGTGKEKVSTCKFVCHACERCCLCLKKAGDMVGIWGGVGVLGSRKGSGELVKVVCTGSSPILYVLFYVSLHTCYTFDFLSPRGDVVMTGYGGCLKGGGWAGFIRILAFIIYCSSLFSLLRVQLVGASFWSVFLLLFGMEEFFYLSEVDFILVNSIFFFFSYCLMRSL